MCLILCAFNAKSQNMTDMRLNEIVVENTDGFIDDYGNRSSWIEIYNTSYGTVDVAGCFLSDDPNNLKKYRIPKGDVLTKIKPKQHLLFYTDGTPDKGTFHTSFILDSTSTEVFLVNTNGKDIIDHITFNPALLSNGKSWGRRVDGIGSSNKTGVMARSWRISQSENAAEGDNGWDVLTKVTPSSANVIDDKESKLILLKEKDPHGGIMAITAMSVVFFALLVLYFLFRMVSARQMAMEEAKKIRREAKAAKKSKPNNANVTVNIPQGEYTDEEIAAAIVVAIELAQADEQIHDVESNILTFKNIKSPWGNKAQIMKQDPQINR